MPTKEELEAQLAETQEELTRVRGELTAARANVPTRVTFPARPDFRGGTELSEGERQDLAVNGVARDPFTGAQLLASDYGVDVVTEDGRARLAAAERDRPADAAGDPGIPGVTHVYPSVAPGVLAADAPVRGGIADTTRVEGE